MWAFSLLAVCKSSMVTIVMLKILFACHSTPVIPFAKKYFMPCVLKAGGIELNLVQELKN